MNATNGKVVFTGTSDWWQIVNGNDEIVCDAEPFTGEWEQAAELAEINVDDDESWVSVVTHVDERHTAIKVGDYACCDGYGCDVIFVRL